MSIPEKSTVSCPKCGKQFQVTTFASVNTDFSPDLAETIISGKRFDAVCPSCGFVAHLEYDLLYHDMNHEAMIWVIHTNNVDYKKKIAEVRATDFLHYKVTRIVSDMNDLREKVACLEAGRDDRVIELCKVFLTDQLLRQQPDFKFRNAFYTYSGGKQIVFFYDDSGKELSCYLEDEVYTLIRDMFQTALMQMDAGPYQIIDCTWAVSFFDNAAVASEEDTPSDDNDNPCAVEESNIAEVPQVRFCRKCGAKLLSDSLFCSYCGTKVLTATQ